MSRLSNRLEIMSSINLHSTRFGSGNPPPARNGRQRFLLHFKASEGRNRSPGLSRKIRLGSCCGEWLAPPQARTGNLREKNDDLRGD